ncbi:glycosyltransferase family 2 protein [Vibrio sp. TRT 17S01]|uniref:glycosyltransferase family 2 protein n=1 Tax=Vibrio sp. TRT 17S01 TaxID=3418505 RepID=UPI003CEFC22E
MNKVTTNNTVSVIIPCTDRVEGLEKCLQSVINQKCNCDIEIILVENNSKDRTLIPDLVEKINSSYLKHYYMDECENANWARNYGVDVSRGNYIAYLDSDDWWDNCHIQNSLDLMVSGTYALYSSYIVDNGKFQKTKQSYDIKSISPYEFLFGKNAGVAQTSSFFLDRTVFDTVRWDNDLKRSQDYDFFIMVQKSIGWTYNPNSNVIVYWEEGAVRTISTPAFEMFLDKHENMMSKNELAQYLSEISKAVAEKSKIDFIKFKKRLEPVFSYLSLKDRLILKNYFTVSLYIKLRDKFRSLKAIISS